MSEFVASKRANPSVCPYTRVRPFFAPAQTCFFARLVHGVNPYDTDTARWTAKDPIGAAGGDSDWYGYCLDDPVNGNDPAGLLTNEYGDEMPEGRTIIELFADPIITPFLSHNTKKKVQSGLREKKNDYTDENDWKMRRELENEANSYNKTKAFFDSYITPTDDAIMEMRVKKAGRRIGK